MDFHPLLKFGHIVGAVCLGGGLLAVFVAELRAYTARDGAVFAEAARYTALCYDALVVPGAVLLAISGVLLVYSLDVGFFELPWLAGMWLAFVFEFVEGNTLTRIQFRRTVRVSDAARVAGRLDAGVRADARPFIARLAHFLDLPMLAAILWCGTMRPDRWLDVGLAFALAGAAGLVLTFAVPYWADRRRRR